jgi:hypothetical protein
MNMVDDATGTTLLRFGEQETIWAAVDVLRAWIEKYGVPRALYTDWRNVYKRSRPLRRKRRVKRADALRTDVREAGDRDHRGGEPAGEGTGGAEQRHPAGPADQEDAAAGHRVMMRRRTRT